MSEQLNLGHVRSVLVRLEETIIFGLLERAQYRLNAPAYEPGFFGDALEGESLVGFLLLECERSHAKVRRYTSPDEEPFFNHLPEPVLPPLSYAANPLRPNRVNINARIRREYVQETVMKLCLPGDDRQYGSSSVCDVHCLQSISRRIHFGKFVAESKYREQPMRFDELVAAGDHQAVYDAITDKAVEAAVLERVTRKATTYTRELSTHGDQQLALQPERIAGIYRDWIIPCNKDVQVQYLFESA